MEIFLLFIGVFFVAPFAKALAGSIIERKKEYIDLKKAFDSLKHEVIKSDQLYLDCERKLGLAQVDIASLKEKLRRVKREPWFRESACVYVLRDTSTELGVIKVGYTIRKPEARLVELKREKNYKDFTFELVGYIWADADLAEDIEQKVHQQLSKYRFRSRYAKELFIYNPFEALAIVHQVKNKFK